MISLNELIKNVKIEDIPKDHLDNLNSLLVNLNKLRAAYGKPLKVTSGYRSMADHMRIYADKDIRDLNKIPMKSKHLSGQACDFADPDNKLKDFINDCTPEELEEFGLWFESFPETPGWVHCQNLPPKSGKRFFIP